MDGYKRKNDNIYIKYILMNNSAKLSKKSFDTSKNPLDSNL